MSRSKLSHQPHGTFIPQGPNAARYSVRLSKDDKTESEPILRRLHEEGASRDVMLREIRAEVGIPVSIAQLDGLRRKLGLHIYRPRPSEGSTRVLDSETLSIPLLPQPPEPEDSADEGTLNQDPSFSCMKSEGSHSHTHSNCAVRLPVLKDSYGSDDVLMGDVEAVSDEIPMRIGSLQISDVCEPGSIISSQSTVRNGTQSEHDAAPRFVPGRTIPSLIDKTTGLQILVDLSTQKATPGPNSEIQVVHDGSGFTVADSPALEPNAVTLSEFHNDHQQGDGSDGFAPDLCDYYPSTISMFYSTTASGSHISPDDVARFYHAAAILHNLRAFDQAFDLCFYIYRQLKSQTEAPSPRFVVAAIQCARSAQTTVQFHLASLIVDDIHEMLSVYYCSDFISMSLEFTQTRSYLDILRTKFFHVEERRLGWSSPEAFEDTAYWVGNALAMSQHKLSGNFEDSPDYALSFLQHNILEHLYRCQTTGESLHNGLTMVCQYIQQHRRSIDKLFASHWHPSGQNNLRISQALSCLILEAYAEGSLRPEKGNNLSWYKSHRLFPRPPKGDNPPWYKNHRGFPCNLNNQVIATIPFVLMEWVHRVKRSKFSRLVDSFDPRHTESLLMAAKNFQSVILHNTAEYTELIDLCLSQMASPAPHQDETVSIISSSRFLGIAAGMAGLKPLSNVLTAAKVENTSSDEEVLEGNPEDDAELSNHRTSLATQPTLARSYRSSMSSGFRSFRDLSSRIRDSFAMSVETRRTMSPGEETSHRSSRFSISTGMSSGLSVRQSFHTISSDITMSG